MKHNEEFADFLRDHVNLNQSRIEGLEEHISAVTTYMKNNHDGFRKTDKQGSHALGTIIKPVKEDDEYDADLLAIMDKNGDKPAPYVDQLYKTLQASDRYKDKIEKRARCVKIKYAGDCHLDIVPCVQDGDKFYVCPRNQEELEETDGTGFRDWFNDQNRITKGNLKRTVRLLKFLRDHKDNFEVPSVILTALAGKAIQAQDEGSEKVNSMADTVATVLTRIDNYLKKHDKIPTIKNPGNTSLTLNTQWTDSEYQNFRSRIKDYAKTAWQARDEEDKEKSIAAWQRLFGNGFKPRGRSSDSHSRGGNQGAQRPQMPPSNPSGIVTKAVIPPAVRVTPRRLYAGTPAVAETATADIAPDEKEMSLINESYPQLVYYPEDSEIRGVIEVNAWFDQPKNKLCINTPPTNYGKSLHLMDTFSIAIKTEHQILPHATLPLVYETDGRPQQIILSQGMAKADLHFYESSGTSNLCCLTISTAYRHKGMLAFINEFIIPFFYRLAYVDKHGLTRSRQDLWPEYSHGNMGWLEYRQELKRYKKMKRGNNKPCPCGSSKKYRDCHKPECDTL